jgi:hypothetical protein
MEKAPIVTSSVYVSVIEVDNRPLDGADGQLLYVDYTLRAPGLDPDVITLAVPDVGELEHIWCSVGTDAHLSMRGDLRVIDIRRAPQARFDGATIRLRIRWDGATRQVLHGSPICILPSALPQVLTMHGPYTAAEFPDPVDHQDEPRIRFRSMLAEPAGSVKDPAGEYLMAALPIEEEWKEQVWHADDSLVLAGAGLGSLDPARRIAIRDRLLEIHAMLGAEFGRGDRVRSLAIYDHGADAFVRQPGQFSALDLKYLETTGTGRFLGERLMARHLASTWWAFGVRPAGRPGPAMALGLTHYAVMRWFAATGKHSALEAEVDFAKRLITKLEAEGTALDPVAWQGMRVALALFDASIRGPEVTTELRRWCTDDWGRSVPVATLVKRLAKVGAWLPK